MPSASSKTNNNIESARFLNFFSVFDSIFFTFPVFTAAATPYGLQARAASHAMHMLLHVRVKGSGHACFLHRSSLGSP
jgi:hypothetical protein